MNNRRDRFGDDGGMVVRVVARVQEMMVQRSMKPVVEELNWPSMQKDGHDYAICTPQWNVLSAWDQLVAHIEKNPVEEDLIIPAALSIDLLEIDTLVDNPVGASCCLQPGDADPNLIV